MRRFPTLVIVLILVTAACGGSTGDTTTTADETTTSAPTTAESTAAETTTTTTAETTTSSTPTGGTNDCVVGTWLLDTASLVDDFDALFEASEMPAADVAALDGTYTIEFSVDGSFTATRDSWGFAVGVESGSVSIEYNGIETGTWSVDGSTLTANIESSDVEIDATMEAGGQQMEMPQGQIPEETQAVVGAEREYECSADELTLISSGFEATLTRT